MSFKDLTKEEKEYFVTTYSNVSMKHNEKMDVLSQKYNISERTVRRWANRMGIYNNNSIGKSSQQLLEASNREIDIDTKVLLVTSAQNKTVVNTNFIDSLESYRDYLNGIGVKAQIVVIPVKYRNPTMHQESSNDVEDDYWDSRVSPYLYYSKLNFGDTLISADSRVVPTSCNPLSGYESLAYKNNLVLGHPRIHYKVLPRFKDERFRTMNTTGFCTYKNYSKSKSGDKAFIHHSYGFTIIEKKTDDICFKPRVVKVKSDGTFIDLVNSVNGNKVSKSNSIMGVVLGDIHHAQLDNKKINKTLQVLDTLKPKEIVLHDVFDGESVNPHETKDFFIKKRKIVEGRNLIEKEVKSAIDFTLYLQNRYGKGTKVMVVHCNHDSFLDRHINDSNWKNDLYNSEYYLECAKIQQTVDLRLHGNIFGYLLNNSGGNYIKLGDSHFIADYQVGAHGDYGANGSRGSVDGFKKLNQKMIHGHSHSPAIVDGVTCVGVSCHLNQYYNTKGLSSWAHADCIIHDNGKNQLIIYDEEYQISNFL